VVSGRTVVAGWQSVVLTKFCFDYQAEARTTSATRSSILG